MINTNDIAYAVMFQSTHPRGVRHFPDSIVHHAIMFQSTHPRGVRHILLQVRKNGSCFNPRTREGCDLNCKAISETERVSIHAPARGATCSVHINSSGLPRFNPRTREGCDPILLIYILLKVFQSTHPRGVRPIRPLKLVAIGSFNPRTREGCDFEMF